MCRFVKGFVVQMFISSLSAQMFIVYFQVTFFHGSEPSEMNGGGKILSILLLQ